MDWNMVLGLYHLVFRRSVTLGTLSGSEFQFFMEDLASRYHGDMYHLISKNCNHFPNEINMQLTGRPIPGWVNRLARLGLPSLLMGLCPSAFYIALCVTCSELSFHEYRPLSIAAAAMLCSANTIPSLLKNPGGFGILVQQIDQSGDRRLFQINGGVGSEEEQRKTPKVLPQFRVTTRAGMRYSDSSSSSCSSSSSSNPYN